MTTPKVLGDAATSEHVRRDRPFDCGGEHVRLRKGVLQPAARHRHV
jgi:hypothetical protein